MDTSRWPLVVVYWPRSTTLADADAYYDERVLWFAKQERFVMVLDGSGAGALDPIVRKRVMARSKAQADEAARWVAAEAIVLRGAIQQGVLTALEWLVPPRHLRRKFRNFDEALAWAETMVPTTMTSEVVARSQRAPHSE